MPYAAFTSRTIDNLLLAIAHKRSGMLPINTGNIQAFYVTKRFGENAGWTGEQSSANRYSGFVIL